MNFKLTIDTKHDQTHLRATKIKDTKTLCAYNGATRGNLFFQFLLSPPKKTRSITMVLPWCYHGITGYYHGMIVVMRWC